MSYSIQILNNALEEHKRSWQKSINSYTMNFITKETHNKHLINLRPKIANLQISINKLKS
jgi:hypothetical protein